MFGFKKRKAAPGHLAAEQTNTPLSNAVTMMMAQELPLLDSADRVRVYQILEEYDGPTIMTQEDLPAEIKQIMDL
ncbi:hypothetical protein [Corynebacterium epidermidicanis]|nr:hypothetical protein [Corynebacterium epidermidicanis]